MHSLWKENHGQALFICCSMLRIQLSYIVKIKQPNEDCETRTMLRKPIFVRTDSYTTSFQQQNGFYLPFHTNTVASNTFSLRSTKWAVSLAFWFFLLRFPSSLPFNSIFCCMSIEKQQQTCQTLFNIVNLRKRFRTRSTFTVNESENWKHSHKISMKIKQ